MNIKCVFKFLGLLTLIITIWMICPLVYSLSTAGSDVRAFTGAIAVGLLCALALFAAAGKTGVNAMGMREAFVSVTLSWVMASAIGALPYLFCGSAPTYTDAFFEAMSGFTTTGSTILRDVESAPRGLILWRGLTHWLGGMGIIVLTLSIMPLLGIGGFQLYSAEAPGLIHEKLTPRVQQTAIILWCIYLGLTVLETLLLLAGGMELFDAVTNSMGTISSGGFSPRNNGIAHYKSAYVDWVVTLFMYLSGASFALHFQVLRGRSPRFYFRDPEFRFYTSLLAALSLAVSLGLYSSGEYARFADALRLGTFQIVSFVTTAGFVSADYVSWPHFPQAILFFAIFSGGCSGSTAGGIKQARLLILCRHAERHLLRRLSPRAVLPLRIGKESPEIKLIASCLGFFALYMFLFFTGSFLVSLTEPDLLTAMSAVASTLGNVGLAFGSVGIYADYADQAQSAKWLYCFFMLCGRLELYTVLVLFSKAFWRGGIVWRDAG